MVTFGCSAHGFTISAAAVFFFFFFYGVFVVTVEFTQGTFGFAAGGGGKLCLQFETWRLCCYIYFNVGSSNCLFCTV